MNDESERRRVDMVRRDRQLIREAGRLLSAEQREQEQRHQERQQRTDRFIRHWWLRCPDLQAHWSATLPVREATEQFAQVFFGKSVSLLTLEDRFTTVYTCSRDIPADLHPASWFPAGPWFCHELRACGGLCRTSSGLATVSRFRSGTAARTLSATARHARDRSGRTAADPYGAAETGLLTCHDGGHDTGGRTAEPSQRRPGSFIQGSD